MKFEKISYTRWYGDIGVTDNPYIAQEMLEEVFLPRRATEGSAGYDFFAPYDVTIQPHDSRTIKTGMRWVCNEDEYDRVLLIVPRSGMGFKTGVRLQNTVGVIDSDYCNAHNEGHIAIKLYNPQDKPLEIPAGTAFAQGFIVPFLTCENDKTTEQREGGFGSTDK